LITAALQFATAMPTGFESNPKDAAESETGLDKLESAQPSEQTGDQLGIDPLAGDQLKTDQVTDQLSQPQANSVQAEPNQDDLEPPRQSQFSPNQARPDQTRSGQTRSPSSSPLQELHFSRARSSIKQTLNRYMQQVKYRGNRSTAATELQAALKTDCDRLTADLEKLDQGLIRIAVFGLVSRGKSAVINALMGQKLLQTGPLHGVTQYPRSVYWTSPTGQINIELIDTPGLDEVGGESRASMAQTVAQQADLILFVVAGDITRTEYQALTALQTSHKPLILPQPGSAEHLSQTGNAVCCR
jgi:predicted GTPase